MKKIGLLGGSFDPIHVAHIALGHAALRDLALDQVQFIPAAQPWQRDPLHATPSQRCEMIRLAIAHEPRFCLNCLEIDRGGPTYTIDTVRALPSGATYIWLLGADQLKNFCTWRDWRKILDYVDLAAVVRPGTPLATPLPLAQYLTRPKNGISGRQVHILTFLAMPVSASAIRQKIAQHLPTQNLLPPAVQQYIDMFQLYQPLVR